MSEETACRVDVWLWRARFFKSRSLAARFVEDGRVRLSRTGAEGRLDKPSRPVKPGDAGEGKSEPPLPQPLSAADAIPV